MSGIWSIYFFFENLWFLDGFPGGVSWWISAFFLIKNKNDHVESEGDFDSEVESVSSRMSAETVDSQIHLVDQNPIVNASDEVDLSGFHDVCRKILAKQIPSGYTSGELS